MLCSVPRAAFLSRWLPWAISSALFFLFGGLLHAQGLDKLPSAGVDPRFSFGVRAGFTLPQNDLKLTTGTFPQLDLGFRPERLIHGVHQVRPVADWWYFRPGQQDSATSLGSQVLKTRVRSLNFGGEYLYRIAGENKRLSVGGGLYLMRWSVASVNTLTLSAGTAQASGTSHWMRLGEGAVAVYRLSHRLELESRWVHSHYGYEHIPVNVATLGAGYRF